MIAPGTGVGFTVTVDVRADVTWLVCSIGIGPDVGFSAITQSLLLLLSMEPRISVTRGILGNTGCPRPHNCIFDAYTPCWKNVALIFSFLMSWCHQKGKYRVQKSAPRCPFDIDRGVKSYLGNTRLNGTLFKKGLP